MYLFCFVSLHKLTPYLSANTRGTPAHLSHLANKVGPVLISPPNSGLCSLRLCVTSIYLSAWLASLSSRAVCLFVSVPGVSAACRVACKVLTQTRPLRAPLNHRPSLSLLSPAAAGGGGLSCKLRDPELNKSVGD